jgi:hypothetical protein
MIVVMGFLMALSDSDKPGQLSDQMMVKSFAFGGGPLA